MIVCCPNCCMKSASYTSWYSHDSFHIWSAVHGQTHLIAKKRKVAWKLGKIYPSHLPGTQVSNSNVWRLYWQHWLEHMQDAQSLKRWFVEIHQVIFYNLQFNERAWWLKDVKKHPPPSPAGKADQNWSLGPKTCNQRGLKRRLVWGNVSVVGPTRCPWGLGVA